MIRHPLRRRRPAGRRLDRGRGRQRRRRQARAPEPGAARRLHAAPPPRLARGEADLDRRRRPPQPRRPLQPDRLPADGRRGHRLRPADPDPARDRGSSAARSPTRSTGSRRPTSSTRCGCRSERMSESFVPSIREYAAHFQIDSRRLGPRQLLMHPGPVNRGVELSGEVIDSPQSLIDRAGRLRPGRADGDPLRAARGAGDRRAGPGAPSGDAEPTPTPIGQHPREPRRGARRARRARARTWSCAKRRVLDPVAGIDGAHDVVVRDGRIAELAAPGAADAEGAEVVEAEGLHAFPAFFDPHVHLRTPGQEHKEDIETGTRAAAAGGYCGVIAMANTEPPVSTAADVEALREAGPRGRLGPGRLPRHGDQGHGGRGADRDGRAARGRRDRLLRRRPADPQRRHDAPRAPVPAPLRRHDRPARGGPGALRRRRHARGPGLGGARPRRHPLGLGVDDDRPRRRPRRLRGRPHPRPAPLRRRVGRGGPRRQGRRGADQLPRPARTTSASPTRRSAASTRTASR